jgi:hypothetical protein
VILPASSISIGNQAEPSCFRSVATMLSTGRLSGRGPAQGSPATHPGIPKDRPFSAFPQFDTINQLISRENEMRPRPCPRTPGPSHGGFVSDVHTPTRGSPYPFKMEDGFSMDHRPQSPVRVVGAVGSPAKQTGVKGPGPATPGTKSSPDPIIPPGTIIQGRWQVVHILIRLLLLLQCDQTRIPTSAD